MGLHYGWRPQLPDHRDYRYKVAAPGELPKSVDLRPSCPPIVHQGDLGSCTANAIGSADYFVQMKQGLVDAFMPSRLFVYYNERKREGTIPFDSGAYIRDGLKSIGKHGVCPETEWPYDVSKFRIKPSKECYKHAATHQAVDYYAIDCDLVDLRRCLADGYPFVFGFSVGESFESAETAKTGVMPVPGKTERILGGHAVMAVGYDDGAGRLIVANSWGTDWGDKGFFHMPYEIIESGMASDFWTIRAVEEGR